MRAKNLTNIAKQAIQPSRFQVMLKKVGKRLERKGRGKRETLDWLQSSCTDFQEFARNLDADLWREAEEASASLEAYAAGVLAGIPYNLGGGGAYPFLYFVTRYMEPETIVETGVAAGFSSASFLTAINANGKGKLHSSDFPYFRLPNPEQYIGVVVEERLKDKWGLHIDGDETNLPRIVDQAGQIDIFHYDSDKSYSGREFAVSLVSKAMSRRGIIIMDDIQDNSYFRDYLEDGNLDSWRVFEFQGKYFGMIGELKRHEERTAIAAMIA